jgi:hypothetical protein
MLEEDVIETVEDKMFIWVLRNAKTHWCIGYGVTQGIDVLPKQAFFSQISMFEPRNFR